MIYNILKGLRQKWHDYNHWNTRINEVMSCPDNEEIRRVKDAGKINGDYQIMHNGQKIICGSYYGDGIKNMLKKNKGVHEPQEEMVFSKVIESLKEDPVMVELGSYWAFYSMWLLQKRPAAKVFLYEPAQEHLLFGINNFKLNNLDGDFNHAYISDNLDLDGTPPTYNLPFIMESKDLDFIDILHSDIQGYEFNLLEGAKNLLKNNKIGYLFISTHENDIHTACIDLLRKYNYHIVCECDLDNTYSYDGLIVAKSQFYKGFENIKISRKQA